MRVRVATYDQFKSAVALIGGITGVVVAIVYCPDDKRNDKPMWAATAISNIGASVALALDQQPPAFATDYPNAIPVSEILN